MRVQENWCPEKGRPQECMRTGRRSSPDAPEPALSLKRRVLRGDSAGAPREEEGTQESRDRGESAKGEFQEDRAMPRQSLSVTFGSSKEASLQGS